MIKVFYSQWEVWSILCTYFVNSNKLCPYCPNKRFYNSGGWKDHMSKKHSSIPWYGASTSEEYVQGQAMLDILSTNPSAHIGSLETGVSSLPSSQQGSTKTSKQGEKIQSLIKEVPTNVKFLQSKQAKPKKRYGGTSISTGSVASTS